jgi:methionine sulfoxide reductase catalytic subunit
VPDLSSEITPEPIYKSRRIFVKSGVYAGAALASGALYRAFKPQVEVAQTGVRLATTTGGNAYPKPGPKDPLNTFTEIASYNNFYEFSTDKSGVVEAAKDFQVDPWSLSVGGMVGKPLTLNLQELRALPAVERVYRMRCVEGWSMVIPWVGIPLKALLEMAQPLPAAKYVAFESYHDDRQMPNSQHAGIPLPYEEGLRLDEAMHPLTLLATGLYGRSLPNQNGAPVRLVVPWKYGFKGIKSIVKITLTDRQPPSTWNIANPEEYGFYSNVNPNVPHPRWSQATELRIGETLRRPTLMFNGYADEVAGLYAGMDLKLNF